MNIEEKAKYVFSERDRLNNNLKKLIKKHVEGTLFRTSQPAVLTRKNGDKIELVEPGSSFIKGRNRKYL